MKSLILAAGYAIRLYPLTKQFPKPLLTVGNRPIIDYIVDKLDAIDAINEIIVVTNSKFISVFKEWALESKSRKHIEVIDDLTSSPEDKRGAIGDMDFSIKEKLIKEDLLVLGGDNLFDEDLERFLSFAKHHSPYPAIGVYDIKDPRQTHRYGVIKLDGQNKVIDFVEKPEISKSTFVAMCLYYFPKEKLNLIGKYLNVKTEKNDAMGFYIDWLRKNDKVYGFVFKGRWYDIGDHKFYSKVKETFTYKNQKTERLKNGEI